MTLYLLLVAFALLIALYLVNEQRRKEKLKVDSAVIMLGTLLVGKKNVKWRRQWGRYVEWHTPLKGNPYNKFISKEFRAQVSVLVKTFKLLDDKGV